MAGMSIALTGFHEATALCAGLGQDLSDLTELHTWMVIAAQEEADITFPTGPALSPLTLAARRRGGSTPLFDSGRLRRSLTGGSSGGIATGTDTLNIATREWGRLGSNLIYAGVHHRGAIIRARRARFLTIPMSKQASAAGSYGAFPKELDLLPLKKRPGYIAVEPLTKSQMKSMKGGGARPHTKAHWLLVESVQIPQRAPERGILPTTRELIPVLEDTAGRWIREKIKRRGGGG